MPPASLAFLPALACLPTCPLTTCQQRHCMTPLTQAPPPPTLSRTICGVPASSTSTAEWPRLELGPGWPGGGMISRQVAEGQCSSRSQMSTSNSLPMVRPEKRTMCSAPDSSWEGWQQSHQHPPASGHTRPVTASCPAHPKQVFTSSRTDTRANIVSQLPSTSCK